MNEFIKHWLCVRCFLKCFTCLNSFSTYFMSLVLILQIKQLRVRESKVICPRWHHRIMIHGHCCHSAAKSHLTPCDPMDCSTARLPPCPPLSPRVCSNSRPLSQWCHPTIAPPVALFSWPRSFPASGSFPVWQLSASGGQNIQVSTSADIHLQIPSSLSSLYILIITMILPFVEFLCAGHRVKYFTCITLLDPQM